MKENIPMNNTPASELVAINPADLALTVNIRRSTDLDPTFLASIKDHGVLVPIVASRDAEGTLTVLYGHRRTAAAAEAGLPTVPVMVVDSATESGAGQDNAAEVGWIVAQWAENEHRTGLPSSDRVAAVDQLAAFGISAAQIAKRTKAGRAEVDAALSVAKSTTAHAALADPQLSITDAAVFAEFDGDEDALTALRRAVTVGQFEHTAQHLRDRRDQQARRQTAAHTLTSEGVTLIDPPDYRSPTVRLSRLCEDGHGIDVGEHAACPGHVAYLDNAWVFVVTATGEEIGEDDLADEDTDELRYSEDELEEKEVWFPQFCCTDPLGHGHPMPAWLARSHSQQTTSTENADPASIEALAEGKSRERREVIDNNKAWRSAETVRLDWLRTFLTRKTLPKQGAAFSAATLTRDPYLLTGTNAREVAADLLAPTKEGPAHVVLAGLIDKASEARTHVLTLGLILGASEAATSVQSWRTVDTGTQGYLTYLSECGYTLSDIERRACRQDPLPVDTDDEQ